VPTGTKLNDIRIPLTRQQACVTYGPVEFDYSHDFAQLLITAGTKTIERKLATLTGAGISRRLEFEPVINLTDPQSAFLEHTFRFLLEQLDRTESRIPPLVLAEMEQALIVAFLCASRHNYSRLLQCPTPGLAPRQVRMTEEYIAANWDRPIRMEDLVALTGCSGRTLFRAFKQSRGYSPMAFSGMHCRFWRDLPTRGGNSVGDGSVTVYYS
jgi:AraC-like DNA-binding protein